MKSAKETVRRILDELRDIIRDEIQTTIRQELGKQPAVAGDFVSVCEAARIASVSPQAIRAWMRAGRLTGCKAGRVLRVRRVELECFLAASQLPAPTTEASPEALADRRFRQRQIEGRERRRSARRIARPTQEG
jgi:hypothetical protein